MFNQLEDALHVFRLNQEKFNHKEFLPPFIAYTGQEGGRFFWIQEFKKGQVTFGNQNAKTVITIVYPVAFEPEHGLVTERQGLSAGWQK